LTGRNRRASRTQEGFPVGTDKNVLIVEDDSEWRGIYERTVTEERPDHTVMVAKDLPSAERMIEAAEFAVAFVDIGLDVENDRNVDGLRVMEVIRAAGDKTSIVVVTGRTGPDLIPIVKEALKKHRAYDTVPKRGIDPDTIRHLLNGGLEAYRGAAVSERLDARDALRGAADPMNWDYEVRKAVGFQGDAGVFYDFLRELVGPYLPLVPKDDGSHADQERGFVQGVYWSRAIASAVGILIAAVGRFDEAQAALAGDGGSSVGRGEVIHEVAGHGVRGVVTREGALRREDFGPKEPIIQIADDVSG
jgi:ActR/RegA family two-component response regulator